MQIKVIIPASGMGRRLGGKIPKQFQLLGGLPILLRTIDAFQKHKMVIEIVVAVPPEYVQEVKNYGHDKVLNVVEGGDCRASSVNIALQVISKGGIVLIHDGARPFVSEETITAVAVAVNKYGAAVACTPITDTIKEVSPMVIDEGVGQIISTPNRSNLWRAQTPQGFTYELIMQAHQGFENIKNKETITDDSALVERLGKPVYIVKDSPRNIKITTPEDLIIAEAFVFC